MNIVTTLLIGSACMMQVLAAPLGGQKFSFTINKDPTVGSCDDLWSNAQKNIGNFLQKASVSMTQTETPQLLKNGQGCSFKFGINPGPLEISCNLFYNREEIKLNDGSKATEERCRTFATTFGKDK